MDNYLLLKIIHILSAVVIAGTGTGIAFFMLMAYRSANTAAIAVTARIVVLADWLFTAPAVVVQFVTGVLLMERLGYAFTAPWFLAVISLFVFIGLCWIPVVLIQYRLRALAETSVTNNELDPRFHKLMHLWTALGIPAFAAVLVMFWLMVFKPLAIV
ncbi:DUF2269 family protein [Parendozoicomonas haliclonae]|uniref:DUF2269 domain-containing protein n=1 Tax=Parendozoicomonas haliclonae TaxID=1960125 RepID=A0A1X7AFZ1_9GAMM|nr:DUF2269 domain-containing protein [Parendozoicomonas haliclonae]SMA37442.1 hypothetical protein EHSB41UT_00740 [Parendozoicomonas haliclonae]